MRPETCENLGLNPCMQECDEKTTFSIDLLTFVTGDVSTLSMLKANSSLKH
jgi:hypothetical protein